MMPKQRKTAQSTAQSTGPVPVAVRARNPSSYPVIAPPPSACGGVPVVSAPAFDSVPVFSDPMPLSYHQGVFPSLAAAASEPYPTYHAAPPPLPYYRREPVSPRANTTNYFTAPPRPNHGREPVPFVAAAASAPLSANQYQNQAAPPPIEPQRPQRPPPVAPQQPTHYWEAPVVPAAPPASKVESPVITSLRHNEEVEAALWRLAPPWEDDGFEY